MSRLEISIAANIDSSGMKKDPEHFLNLGNVVPNRGPDLSDLCQDFRSYYEKHMGILGTKSTCHRARKSPDLCTSGKVSCRCQHLKVSGRLDFGMLRESMTTVTYFTPVSAIEEASMVVQCVTHALSCSHHAHSFLRLNSCYDVQLWFLRRGTSRRPLRLANLAEWQQLYID